MRTLATVLVALMTAAGLAQSGWTHPVESAFEAPFEALLLPWTAITVEAAPIEDCWIATDPPFLGTGWRFWCYTVGQAPETTDRDLTAALRDLGFRPDSVVWWGETRTPPEPLHETVTRPAVGTAGKSPAEIRYWIFEAPDGTSFVSLVTTSPKP